MPDAYICRRLRRTKITRKASDAAEYIELFGSFTQYQSSCTTTHISEDVQRITLNASCMTISGGRTKQLDIFCHVTGFTSDFLSFIANIMKLSSFMEPFKAKQSEIGRRLWPLCSSDIQTIEYVHLTNTDVSKVNILKFTLLNMCSPKYRGTNTCT